MLLSKYVKIFNDISEEVVLYNSMNRGIVSLSENMIHGRRLDDALFTEEESRSLTEMEFLRIVFLWMKYANDIISTIH